MATLADFRNERLRKLKEIRDRGINPYPSKSTRDTIISDILANFDGLKGKTVTIAGRITAIRKFGKIAFVKIRDYSGEIQVFMQRVISNCEGSSRPTGSEDRELARNDGPSDRYPRNRYAGTAARQHQNCRYRTLRALLLRRHRNVRRYK